MFTLDMRLTVALEGSSTHSHFTDEEIKGRSHLERVRMLSASYPLCDLHLSGTEANCWLDTPGSGRHRSLVLWTVLAPRLLGVGIRQFKSHGKKESQAQGRRRWK